ncbi:MAG TPA: hypothetical protein ENI07_16675 [Desulfobacterales bacterium]|nr:hypothetical protein [Desulfobacterales bacterium]
MRVIWANLGIDRRLNFRLFFCLEVGIHGINWIGDPPKADKGNHRRKVQDVRRMSGTLGLARRVWAVVAGPINSDV